jgi:hypothetical protein
MEGTSDPDARKGVRAQRTRSRSNASKSRAALGPCYFRRPATGSGERDHPRVSQRHGGNGRGDTVRLRARGTLRRVNGVARSEARLTPARRRTTPVARRRRRGSGFPRNAANLMTGCGTQQAREPSRGESRRGGAKPRGRNGSWTGGAVGPKVSRGNSGRWEWTREGDVGGGAASHEPQERKGLGPRSELRFRAVWPRGARPVCGRFEGDGRSRSADDELDRSPARRPVKSSRAPDR